MLKLLKNQPYISLIFISILSGTIWRLEIEYHGWAGLNWLSYFHYSIPFSFLLFAIWANIFIKLKLKERILVNLNAILCGIVVFFLFILSFLYAFSQGPNALSLFANTPTWLYYLFSYSIILLIPLTPLFFYLAFRISKQNIRIKYLLISILSMVISIPISILLLKLINHKGNSDFILVIKSGIIIPFWVFSLGILIIGFEKQQNNL